MLENNIIKKAASFGRGVIISPCDGIISSKNVCIWRVRKRISQAAWALHRMHGVVKGGTQKLVIPHCNNRGTCGSVPYVAACFKLSSPSSRFAGTRKISRKRALVISRYKYRAARAKMGAWNKCVKAKWPINVAPMAVAQLASSPHVTSSARHRHHAWPNDHEMEMALTMHAY